MYNFNDFLAENFDWETLNEDYAAQAAKNQAKIQSISDRIGRTKEKASDLDKSTQSYSEKAGKTKDDIAKAVYEAKISSNNAKKAAYTAYITYLQALQTFHQVKGKEIDAKMKASNRRKV